MSHMQIFGMKVRNQGIPFKHTRCLYDVSQRRERKVRNELTDKKIKGGDGEAFIFHSTPGDNGRELKRSTELA